MRCFMAAKQLVVTQSAARVALLETSSTLWLAANVLYVDFPFRNRQDLLKFNNNSAFFTASSRTFKSETRIFSHCQRVVVMNMLTIRTVWCHCLCSCPGSSSVCYSPVFLCHQCKCQHSGKGKLHLMITRK